MIINELGLCSNRSGNAYFANNEQASLVVFTVCVVFTHAEHDLIEPNLCNNWSAQAVNSIPECAMWKLTEPIKFAHL